ncbi:MAG TPA: Type 1 glutamine amidotransferase-like domain-containing protein [Candidatus Limnocylindrales bacterium]|nr:Type 1 glutamine amidotransferase-like domain-containing protein [Candidatus Limnocylindrales bacterium]
MSGPVALHGGGEFQPGDEAFLGALLQRAADAGVDQAIRVAVVPTAAARGRPDLAAAHGVDAFARVAAAASLAVDAECVPVVDAASAADPGLAAWLADADVIHFPGGDPDIIPSLMVGTPVWAAITEAHAGGAVLAGASAGAMALGSWTWTHGGGLAGLKVVRGLVVVPHARAATWDATVERFAAWAPPGLGALGLAEQTGVIEEPPAAGAETVAWRVVGPGEARWLADPEGGVTIVARSGDVIETPVIPL